MSRTSELLKLPGVVAAAVFSRKGHLEELEGALSEAEATEMGNLCADVTMNAELQGRLLGRLADQYGWECQGWITFGPEMSVVTIQDGTCMVQGQQASFNQVVKAMTESAGG
jgi:roadblock/LC7 domain-containing protein